VSAKPTPTTPLPCPFCGEPPVVLPVAEDVASGEVGDAWGEVACLNDECPAILSVGDGETVNDSRGSEEYKRLAIVRWNRRYVFCQHTEVTVNLAGESGPQAESRCDQCGERVYAVPVTITGGGVVYTTEPEEPLKYKGVEIVWGLT
jgi:hypothetical protein